MKRFITVTSGMSGYFAVMVWWNNENPKEGFWEPYDTGLGRYTQIENAIQEAKDWAVEDRCRYVEPGKSFEQ